MNENHSVQVSYQDLGSKGRYAARIEGIDAEGELTISKVSAELIIADHTHVPDVMRGTGTGAALVNRLIADARAAGQRIVPLCPFVRSQVQRHPEWSDVIQF